MSIVFPNNTIKGSFFEIRKLLYLEDGRTDLPPENLLDFDKINMEKGKEISNNEPIQNSLIKLSPNKTASGYLNYKAGHFDYKSEPESFNKDFIKLPINTVEISEEIEIDSYFYKYSFSENKDMFQQINAPLFSADNYLMCRSDFLYMIFYLKFVSISDNYQKCLKSGVKQFQLNENVDEKNILHHFIKHYKDILNSNDKQLKIFEDVKTAKDVADLYTNILIDFLILKLNTLPHENDNSDIVEPEGKKTNRKDDGKILYQLPENFSLNMEGIKSSKLDIRQTAALFHYLKKHEAVITYHDTSYSELVHYLSGHSAHNLRRKSGFGNIGEILRESRNGVSYSTLKSVRSLLGNIIEEINNEIKD